MRAQTVLAGGGADAARPPESARHPRHSEYVFAAPVRTLSESLRFFRTGLAGCSRPGGGHDDGAPTWWGPRRWPLYARYLCLSAESSSFSPPFLTSLPRPDMVLHPARLAKQATIKSATNFLIMNSS